MYKHITKNYRSTNIKLGIVQKENNLNLNSEK
jgi:hypothetical protein